MTVAGEMPLLHVSGSYRDVGRQIGEACAGALRRAVEPGHAGVPRHGRTLEQLLAESERYRARTRRAFPWLIEELDGAAEGAGVDPDLLFAASVEELWEEGSPPPGGPGGQHHGRPADGQNGAAAGRNSGAAAGRNSGAAAGRNSGGPAGRTVGRCTDVLVAPAATSSGHLLVAHNNDLSASSEADVVAVERRVPGDPVIFSIGIGPWISVGWNSAGVSLTGNEVSPNDERCGIPRLLLVRAQLRARTLTGAVALAVHPERASAYNSVIANAREAVNVEASATGHLCWGPGTGPAGARHSERAGEAADGRDALAGDEAGPAGRPAAHAIVHSNHYVSARMSGYEADPGYAARSALRLDRARELLAQLGSAPADERALLAILSDHRNGPDAICRHPAPGTGPKTVFWCVADVTGRRISYGLGNPCRSRQQTYLLPLGV